VAKKAERIGAKKKVHRVEREGKPAVPRVFTDLSEVEKDLVSHMEQGWRLETDSPGGNPVLRHPKSDEVIRPMSGNRSTVEALEERGLIVGARDASRSPLRGGLRNQRRRRAGAFELPSIVPKL